MRCHIAIDHVRTNHNMVAGGTQHLCDALRVCRSACPDNRTVSNTTVTRELSLAVKHLGLNRHDLKSIIIYGFKRSFFPGSYQRKRAYVRQVIDFYEAVELKHFGDVV